MPQADAGLIRTDTRDVQVSLADQPGEAMQREAHRRGAGGHAPVLPTAALGDRAGGPFVTDPADKEGTRTLEPVFLFDVRADAKTARSASADASGCASITARSPLAFQWQRRLQQLFLKQFNPQS